MAELTVPADALAVLRPLFLAIEGDCEPWTDAEIVRRTLIRGAMDYARAADRPWSEVADVARRLRDGLGPL
ncbi:hypothetical protein BH23ACT7_BH23ACT7_27060 [soil metagenome]|jgi:hypothetical protein